MAVGRRCEYGCESWPDSEQYAKCPLCGEPTTRYSNLSPVSDVEARELAFEAYYEAYCAERGQPVDGPLPESPEEFADRMAALCSGE